MKHVCPRLYKPRRPRAECASPLFRSRCQSKRRGLRSGGGLRSEEEEAARPIPRGCGGCWESRAASCWWWWRGQCVTTIVMPLYRIAGFFPDPSYRPYVPFLHRMQVRTWRAKSNSTS